jgi:hypothetical protein
VVYMQEERGHSKYLQQMFRENPPKKKDPEATDERGAAGSLDRDYGDDRMVEA